MNEREANDLDATIGRALDERDRADLLRGRRVVEVLDATHVRVDGVRYVNFASNNYLGLTHHPKVIAAVAEAAQKYGAGSGAAGLISGHSTEHDRAERALADWKRTEAALLLPSGYQANHAVIQTIAGACEASGKRVRFLIDKLAHASLIDAVRAADGEFRVFPHNGLDKLKRLLADAPTDEPQVVLTESIFSMDGDAADLRGFAELKAAHPFTLVLDEAHGSGVYGPDGAGYAAELGLSEIVDVAVVTLSKALGCAGGALCASRRFVDAVLNFGRAYIYSTSVPPTAAAAGAAGIEVLRSEPERQDRLRALARHARSDLRAAGFDVPGLEDSPILPVILGEASAAVAASEAIRAAGMWVVAVRPPTVPKGSSRLRVTLSSQHTDQEVDALIAALRAQTRPG